MDTIGQRVHQRFSEAFPGDPQKLLAERIDMTPDALSRALRGQRAFSSLELARIADVLDADLHWLITGDLDPHRLVLAARHDYDFNSGRRSVPGREGDDGVLKNLGLAYRQAYQNAALPESGLPPTPAEVTSALGDTFVRNFADRLEQKLDVDVVRLGGLSTSYCFCIAGRRVIVVAATGSWFRENWSIAHELGHLVERHTDRQVPPEAREAQEAQANAFAAELLLPEAEMKAMDWQDIDAAELAQRVWDLGVSTEALERRLSSLKVVRSPLVTEWAAHPTQRLLRRHWSGLHASISIDPITQRMDEATSRRIPVGVQAAHLDLIAQGSLGKGTLAWLLGVDPDDLEVDMPTADEEVDMAELTRVLGI
ncbi:ImmA/IrrE family metallo-endopeptidase [Kocuria indica]|uniref:ImmA/IrrE family metallo-endopeptidase n=1 Tax=Kocuria marina subsp. indica TaxID=1049583 RepID=A0A6N9R0Y0_9MICC|nr:MULTISPECIES: XRE family transcriptional regulator [Kocuria]MCT1615890.1 XRE family transcriptional regulator [Kocuria marina]NDO78220.1 ImmA/IrrE family metallo-endopeptidase [Kocuria indica]